MSLTDGTVGQKCEELVRRWVKNRKYHFDVDVCKHQH